MDHNSSQSNSNTLIATLSLFTSLSTLLCCALPALLVTLGLGASLAGLISAAPWITQISSYKNEVFILSGVLLSISTILILRSRNAPCPIDRQQAIACQRLRKINNMIIGLGWSIYLIGFFFAFLAASLLF